MTALVDTGFLLAVLDTDDAFHDVCTATLRNEEDILLADAVLPELAYLVLRDLGYMVLTSFLEALAKGELTIEHTLESDLTRISEILHRYADSRIDYVDCVLMAMAERLKIERVLTLDRRHFRLFRPRHIPAFVILP